MKWLLVFFAVAAMDYAYSAWTQAITAKKRLASSSWAAAILGLSGIATVTYVKDPILLIPAVAGAFAGTWVSIRKGKT